MTADDSPYVHGTDPAEQARLTRLNALLNAASLRELAPRDGERVLDLGCGLAQLTRDLARATGVRALGVERSPDQIAEAQRQARAAGEETLVELRPGDAQSPPLAEAEWGTFDLGHARFVLEHVSDPLAVVRALVRAVRPGGRVVLADDDHDVLRPWPVIAGLDPVWAAYQRTYARAGQDPIVGRRLVELLHAAGATPMRCTWVFFGACAGQPGFPDLVENLARILEGARGAIATAGPMEPDVVDRVAAEVRAWGRRPDAALWYAMAWAEGRKST